MTWITNPENRSVNSSAGEKSRAFAAYTPGEARTAASLWLRNLNDHGPLNISSIRITEERDLFVATVAYSEMTVETTPQLEMLAATCEFHYEDENGVIQVAPEVFGET